MGIQFTKMQGLGNDFVVINAIEKPFKLSPEQIRQMADRRFGIGFDQLLIIEPAKSREADFNFRIFNADGGEVGQCGNGARCVARFIQQNQLVTKPLIRLQTLETILQLTLLDGHNVQVKMGVPRFSPAQIPYIAEKPAESYQLSIDGDKITFSVVNVGNPHAVIWVENLQDAAIHSVGSLLSKHSCFPEGVNVGFMQLVDSKTIDLKVYERGAGETWACGSGACAAAILGIKQGRLANKVLVRQPGGELTVIWEGHENSPVSMIGPAEFVFHGEWSY